ncbi:MULTISPECIES: ATP-binding protein [unclassified Duganella]|uniref:ATP-binding protein n=1 Tax=unclassified Duganella TaxID=2636909 RepID=UPI000881D338|nr:MULTISPECIES: ATP-binding protein [unclassified Duganella]SDH29131.1 two-component system, OmpR family, osmolarity sensor histidine kinase EnvZ [Duganella sp. OV458]SDK37639.1 two-component system, OmpR family, osmolarity sensor histidine kinase EnvZ [Duganella sp. OV510]
MSLKWPRTLLGRNALLLIAAITISQVTAVLVFIIFVQAPRVKDAAALLAAQVTIIQRLLSALPDAERAGYVALLDGQTTPPAVPSSANESALFQPLAQYEVRRFLEEMKARLPTETTLRIQPGQPARLWVQLSMSGKPYWISLPVERSARYRGAWIAISVSAALNTLGVLLAILIHRHINRPLQQLAAAAERLGKGELPEPVSVAGPVEVSSVAAAFNDMTRALADIDATRALMLASLSHDIRTPLTKLRLSNAMPELAATRQASAERYIDDIDAIVQQFIDYARGGDGEDFRYADLNAMIEQLAADFIGLGQPFTLALAPLPPLSIRPVSMLRLLVNLMQNAALYGRVGLTVRTWQRERYVHVAVADDGPGVETSLLPLLKQPFRRGEPAAQPSSGTGLGLAIANRIAQQHGGSLELSLRPEGGFQAELRLPTRR